jgi:hypothetical protein
VSNESGNGKYAPRPGNIPGVAINLGGVDFVLAPLGIRLMREFEARGKTVGDGDAAYAFNVDVILASLHRNYPDLTREELEELLDSHTVPEAVMSVFTQTGLRRVRPGEITPGG